MNQNKIKERLPEQQLNSTTDDGLTSVCPSIAKPNVVRCNYELKNIIMNIRDLLKTRFELIADYPGNSQSIGNVTIEDATASYFRKFPANFQELQWWQKRTIQEMPKYLKFQNNGKVRTVKEYCWIWERCQVTFDGGKRIFLNLQWTPCEEAEYLSSLAQLETVNK